MGQEWQVLDTEPSLFQTKREPQYPQECTLPNPKKIAQFRRRLTDEAVTHEEAETACEHWGDKKRLCIVDVLALNDLEMASAGPN